MQYNSLVGGSVVHCGWHGYLAVPLVEREHAEEKQEHSHRAPPANAIVVLISNLEEEGGRRVDLRRGAAWCRVRAKKAVGVRGRGSPQPKQRIIVVFPTPSSTNHGAPRFYAPTSTAASLHCGELTAAGISKASLACCSASASALVHTTSRLVMNQAPRSKRKRIEYIIIFNFNILY